MLEKHAYYLETKMDGERCQVHVKGTEFKYFSRGCKDDLTKVFGSNSSTGLFSPFFHGQLSGEVQNAIFDGEMMVWDVEENAFLKKCKFICVIQHGIQHGKNLKIQIYFSRKFHSKVFEAN